MWRCFLRPGSASKALQACCSCCLRCLLPHPVAQVRPFWCWSKEKTVINKGWRWAHLWLTVRCSPLLWPGTVRCPWPQRVPSTWARSMLNPQAWWRVVLPYSHAPEAILWSGTGGCHWEARWGAWRQTRVAWLWPSELNTTGIESHSKHMNLTPSTFPPFLWKPERETGDSTSSWYANILCFLPAIGTELKCYLFIY